VQRAAFADGVWTNTDKPEKAGRCYPSARQAKPFLRGIFPVLKDGLVAGAVAGVLSGTPSTVHALVTGRDPLAAARAAGNLVLPEGSPPAALYLAGGVAHVVLSLGWGTVLGVAVRRTSVPPVTAGLAAGVAIAALDLGVLAHGPVGRRWPMIRALPVWPQVADHIAFGVVAGAVLRRRG